MENEHKEKWIREKMSFSCATVNGNLESKCVINTWIQAAGNAHKTFIEEVSHLRQF